MKKKESFMNGVMIMGDMILCDWCKNYIGSLRCKKGHTILQKKGNTMHLLVKNNNVDPKKSCRDFEDDLIEL